MKDKHNMVQGRQELWEARQGAQTQKPASQREAPLEEAKTYASPRAACIEMCSVPITWSLA